MASSYMFATGVENSYPTVADGSRRVDEMEKCGHCEKWRQDFACVAELGIGFFSTCTPISTRTMPAARPKTPSPFSTT